MLMKHKKYNVFSYFFDSSTRVILMSDFDPLVLPGLMYLNYTNVGTIGSWIEYDSIKHGPIIFRSDYGHPRSSPLASVYEDENLICTFYTNSRMEGRALILYSNTDEFEPLEVYQKSNIVRNRSLKKFKPSIIKQTQGK